MKDRDELLWRLRKGDVIATVTRQLVRGLPVPTWEVKMAPNELVGLA